jgi:hypothetical protein
MGGDLGEGLHHAAGELQHAPPAEPDQAPADLDRAKAPRSVGDAHATLAERCALPRWDLAASPLSATEQAALADPVLRALRPHGWVGRAAFSAEGFFLELGLLLLGGFALASTAGGALP